VHALEPLGPPSSDSIFPPEAFLIGNHADELTPWLSVLATVYNASAFLNIPCCAWTFDERFNRAEPQNHFSDMDGVSLDDLALGAEGSNASAYAVYRIWLAGLSRFCGWDIECDTLRIPSTRNWAIIGSSSHLI
jgi:tRNASer (uridine44-2'-O)-methyltransferase